MFPLASAMHGMSDSCDAVVWVLTHRVCISGVLRKACMHDCACIRTAMDIGSVRHLTCGAGNILEDFRRWVVAANRSTRVEKMFLSCVDVHPAPVRGVFVIIVAEPTTCNILHTRGCEFCPRSLFRAVRNLRGRMDVSMFRR